MVVERMVELVLKALKFDRSLYQKFVLLSINTGLLWGVGSIATLAQITSDTTLPNNSVINRTGAVHQITGGTTRGGNLFHSFRDFSLPTGETAFFDHPASIDNILTRVTGNSVSQIDGLIRANGTANLFLLNPNGIIFGANARLDIGGSFVGSTGDRIQFQDGTVFSAANPQASALLTVSVPVGVQFGANLGQIRVNGPGNNLRIDPETFVILRDQRPTGLQVRSGQLLALLGGDLVLEGGNLTAATGRVELGSVAGNNQVAFNLENSTVNYGSIREFRDIRLSQAASIDVSGAGSGTIQLQGRRISLTDGSALLAITTGSVAGGTLRVNAIDSLNILGVRRDAVSNEVQFGSSLYADVDRSASGRGGNLLINTGRLRVADGGQVSTSTAGAGNAGRLSIRARSIELVGGAPVVNSSGLFANVNESEATGAAGDIQIDADRLLISDGAAISASTFGQGRAGNTQIRTEAIAVRGTSPNGFSSGIFAQVEAGASGAGGIVDIATQRLQVLEGGRITTATLGTGNAGMLRVQAAEIEIRGAAANRSASQISATVGTPILSLTELQAVTGQGGDVNITADRLRLLEGGQIAVSTAGTGDAGNLTIRARSIELAGQSDFGRSGLFANAIIGTGDGGDIAIRANQLLLQNGATISASNFPSLNSQIPAGQGATGTIAIQADSLNLRNDSSITVTSAGGDRGSIIQRTRTAVLSAGSSIVTDARGTATGGNIQIDTDLLLATSNSDITANAVSDRGGRVLVNAEGIFGTTFRPTLTGDSDITASSQLGSEFSGVVILNTPEIDPSQGLIELPESVVDATTQVAAACYAPSHQNSFTVSGRGGLPEDAQQPVQGQSVWQDLRLLLSKEQSSTSQAGSDRASNPVRAQASIAAGSNPVPFVEAQNWLVDIEGQVQLVGEERRSIVMSACGQG